MDDGVTRLTHISYAKKFNERCHNIEQIAPPREQRVRRLQARVRTARIRLICGKGRRPRRMVVPSVKAIREKWPIFAGKIRIQVLGNGPLPKDLQSIVDAAGPDLWIEGEDLVDLCKQRSEEGRAVVTPLRRFLHLRWLWQLAMALLKLWRSHLYPQLPPPPLLSHPSCR